MCDDTVTMLPIVPLHAENRRCEAVTKLFSCLAPDVA
jgi:hypothetical protein